MFEAPDILAEPIIPPTPQTPVTKIIKVKKSNSNSKKETPPAPAPAPAPAPIYSFLEQPQQAPINRLGSPKRIIKDASTPSSPESNLYNFFESPDTSSTPTIDSFFEPPDMQIVRDTPSTTDSSKKSRLRRPPPPIPDDDIFDEDNLAYQTPLRNFRDPQEYSSRGILTPLTEDDFEEDDDFPSVSLTKLSNMKLDEESPVNPNIEVKRGGKGRAPTPIIFSPEEALNPNIEVKRGGKGGRAPTPISFSPPKADDPSSELDKPILFSAIKTGPKQGGGIKPKSSKKKPVKRNKPDIITKTGQTPAEKKPNFKFA